MGRHQEDILDRLLGALSIRGILLHQATLFIAATALVVGTAIFLWERHQNSILDANEFRLTEEKIRITPAPHWADTDLKQLVLDDPAPADATILDTQLVSRTASVMQNVGFIERVNRIQKSKSGLDIEVAYRYPVARVELSRVTIPEWPAAQGDQKVMLPVDRFGTVMPEHLSDNQALLKIWVVYPNDFANLETWKRWPDPRVEGAAAVATLFEKSAAELGVTGVFTFRKPNQADRTDIPYQLWIKNGPHILWGNPPGQEADGEANVSDKIAAINALVSQYQPLSSLVGKKIDVRTGKATVAGNNKTAAAEEHIFAELK